MRFAALLLLSATALAESPVFDVASLKPSAPVGGTYSANLGSARNGMVTLSNATLADCLNFAYRLVSDQQVAGPDWIKSRDFRFDVKAKAAPSTPRDQLLLMLRSLLTERFQLAFHTEQRRFPHYVLAVAKTGCKLRTAEAESAGQNLSYRRGAIAHPRMPMQAFVLLLSRNLQTLVVDKTGLTDYYDIKLEWADTEDPADERPSLPNAVQQQLGLKIEASKDPVDVLVVDRADRVPVAN